MDAQRPMLSLRWVFLILIAAVALTGCGEDEGALDPREQWDGKWTVAAADGVSPADLFEREMQRQGANVDAWMTFDFVSSTHEYTMTIRTTFLDGANRSDWFELVSEGVYSLTDTTYSLVEGDVHLRVSPSLRDIERELSEFVTPIINRTGGDWEESGSNLFLYDNDGSTLRLTRGT
ncbi:MAG: hypothetical protein HON70_38555 [Lentisphaerae bacterium]|nr:hypothetical protein [Lentisphaerota bacterium]